MEAQTQKNSITNRWGGLKGCDQFIPGVYPGAFAKQTLDSEKRDL